MTDGWLMQAVCVHGAPWYECAQCDREDELAARRHVLDGIDDEGDRAAVAAVFARVDWRRHIAASEQLAAWDDVDVMLGTPCPQCAARLLRLVVGGSTREVVCGGCGWHERGEPTR